MVSPEKAGDSWIWVSILKGRDFLKANGSWVVGDGKIIDLKTDRWLASGKLAKVKQSCSVVKVAECINPANSSWDLQKIGQTLHHESAMEVVKTPN